MAPIPSGTKRADSPSWLKIAGLSSPLTSAEKRVLAALADGSVADVHSDGVRTPIRAGLIRAIAVGLALPVEQIDPRGVQVVGAMFAERIELDDVTFSRPLRFIGCELTEGLSARRAELHLVDIRGCTITAPRPASASDSWDVPALMLDELHLANGLSLTHSEVAGATRLLVASIGGQLDFTGGTFTNNTGPALIADQLTTTSSVILAGTFTGNGTLGTVRFPGANIDGQLQCEGTFANQTGPSLHADNLNTTGNVIVAGTFTGNGADGAIRLLGANIGGQLDFANGAFTNQTGPALYADNLNTAGSVYLAGTFASNSTDGSIRLLGANVGGQIHCTAATVTNDSGSALYADGLTTTSDVYLASTFAGNGENGTIRLLGATIGGQLHCTDATFTNDSGPTLIADGLTTSDLRLTGEFIGSGELGTIRLLGATIGGQLHCTGTFTNQTGPCLDADNLTTSGNLVLSGTFTGNSTDGSIRLLGATIGGQVQCARGSFTNQSGPALYADGLTTTGNVYLASAFTSDSPDATIRLPGANIGGQLDFIGGTLTNNTGPTLTADGLTAIRNVRLAGDFDGGGELGTIRLPGATIGGQLQCIHGSLRSKGPGALRLGGTKVHGAWILDPAIRSPSTPENWLSLDGFTYAGTPTGVEKARRFGARDWARLLSSQTESYTAQPYQHLAGAYRAAGHEQDAKAVLMAQQDDRRERVVKMERRRWRALGIRWRAVGMRLSKLFTGYGYQSWRALWWLLGLAAVSVVLAFVAGNVAIDLNTDPASPAQWTTVLAHKPTKSDFGTPCSPVELVGVGIDWAVPIIATKAGDACLLNSTHPYGQWWTATSWLFHVLGWAFATLAVAGYTGLIRKL